MPVSALDVFVSMRPLVDEGPGFQKGAYDEYGRAEDLRLPGVRWHLSCDGVIALHLWREMPYGVEIIGELNFGERPGTSSRILAAAETSSDRGRATSTSRGVRS